MVGPRINRLGSQKFLEDFVGKQNAAAGEAKPVAVCFEQARLEEAADGLLEAAPFGGMRADALREAQADEETLVGYGRLGVAAEAREVVFHGFAVMRACGAVERMGVGAETHIRVE